MMRVCKRGAAFLVLGLLFVVMGAAGCGGLGYGKVWAVPGSSGVTIHGIVENWANYDIYWAGLALDNPSGVMFDSKIDGRRLTSDKWLPVTDQTTVKKLVGWINANINFPPTLWEIMSPDNQLFGYMYTACNNIVIKVIDDKTLWVDDLPLPPMDYGPNISR